MGLGAPQRPHAEVVTETIRLGTRGSALARIQAELVRAALGRRRPKIDVRVVPIVTQGDRVQDRATDLDFTDAIDRALVAGEVDLAVHSAKDLPAVASREVRLAAFLPRADPRDALVLRTAGTLASLPPGTRLGSSSPRRRAQLRRARPDLELVELRGNVDTRLARVQSGEIEGAVLAVAGLRRLGRADAVTEVLSAARFLPAPGQGAIAVAVRASDRALRRKVAELDDPRTRAAVIAERSFVEGVGGDCDTPLGALATVRAGRLWLRAELLSANGQRTVAGARRGAPNSARAIGLGLAKGVLRAGGRTLLREARGG